MQYLSSLTRDKTHVPCIIRGSLNHWTTREVPSISVSLLTVLCVSGPSQAVLVIHGWYWVEPPTQRLDWEGQRRLCSQAGSQCTSMAAWTSSQQGSQGKVRLPPGQRLPIRGGAAQRPKVRNITHATGRCWELSGSQPDSRCEGRATTLWVQVHLSVGWWGGLGSVPAGLRLSLPEGQLPISRRALSPQIIREHPRSPKSPNVQRCYVRRGGHSDIEVVQALTCGLCTGRCLVAPGHLNPCSSIKSQLSCLLLQEALLDPSRLG